MDIGLHHRPDEGFVHSLRGHLPELRRGEPRAVPALRVLRHAARRPQPAARDAEARHGRLLRPAGLDEPRRRRSTRRSCARCSPGTSRRCGSCSKPTAARSRSTSVTRSWRSSGCPAIHEDDALRAVRAAAEMQTALEALNEELERRWGVRLTHRTGVNTGEVVAGDSDAGSVLATGDVVNVAARLEQAAPPLGILIGESTYRLVRDAVEVEPVGRLELKGKPEPVPAYRVLARAGRGPRAGRPGPRSGASASSRASPASSTQAISERYVPARHRARGSRARQVPPHPGVRRDRREPALGLHAAAASPTDAASRSGR